MDSAVVLLSGGLNSTVAAIRAAKEHRIALLHIDYGQPASVRQQTAVRAVAEHLSAEHVLLLAMPHVAQIEQASRRGDPDPAGAVAERTGLSGLAPAIWPTFLGAALHWAARLSARVLVTGVPQACGEFDREALPGLGAHDYPREFCHAFNLMLETLRPPRLSISLETPLIDLTRDEIVRLGLRLGAPLDLTWSCHLGGPSPCGDCPPCRSRSRAFLAAGERDPGGPIHAQDRPTDRMGDRISSP